VENFPSNINVRLTKVIEKMIQGTVASGFEKVKGEFERNFNERDEIGAACAIYLEGHNVVDLWGGYTDKDKTSLWMKDTIVPVFSTTKGLAAMAVALACSRGLLDYNEKVCVYWPEFAQNGKELITIKQLLDYQAGLSVIDEKITLDIISDFDSLAKILARQRPVWEPGTKQGYHCWNNQWFQSEIIRRVDPKKRSLGIFFHEEIAEPLDLDFYIGLPEHISEDQIAKLVPFPKIEMLFKMPLNFVLTLLNPWSLASKTMLNPKFVTNHDNFNKRKVLAVEMGSGNGVGNARSIAKAYSEFATGGEILNLNQDILKAISTPARMPANQNVDLVLKTDIIFSLGFIKPSRSLQYGFDEKSFGTNGAGGSIGFADPVKKVGFSYVMNKMGAHLSIDPRAKALRDAFYQCL
jgi:CubicO group peptidase (beta-lactamase class C family)